MYDPIVSQLSHLRFLKLSLVLYKVHHLEELLLAISEIEIVIERHELLYRITVRIFLRHLKHLGGLLRAQFVSILFALETVHRVIEYALITRLMFLVLQKLHL